MAEEEHEHRTINGDEEHAYTHEHEDGHNPHGHAEEDNGLVEIWEGEEDAPDTK